MLVNIEERDNIVTYERKKEVMSRGNRRKSRSGNAGNVNQQAVKKPNILNYLKNNIAAVIVGVMILFVWWTVHDLPQDIQDIKISNATINTKLETLDGNYKTLNSQVWSINTADSNTEEITMENKAEILVASTYFSAKMIGNSTTEKDSDRPIINMDTVDNEEVIGVNVQSNKSETKDSMKNRPFIMQYEENGEEVFFWGKYNEDGQWDGNCIINCYKDSKLKSIMEAVYRDGELESYRQVFRGYNAKNQEIWYVSSRKVEGSENSGETETYFFYGDYEKKFDIKTIKEESILDVDKFLKTIPSTQEGYYNGYTSDGKYNDDSGDAYLVKYDTDGKVRYFYKGKISDGYGNDDGKDENIKSWAFIWGDANDGFHYHEGEFKNGTPQNTKKDWKDPVSVDFIKSIINPDDYNCHLTGLID